MLFRSAKPDYLNAVFPCLCCKLRPMHPAEVANDPVYPATEVQYGEQLADAQLSLGYTCALLEKLLRLFPLSIALFERAVRIAAPPVTSNPELPVSFVSGLCTLCRSMPSLRAFVFDFALSYGEQFDVNADATIVKAEEESDDEYDDGTQSQSGVSFPKTATL